MKKDYTNWQTEKEFLHDDKTRPFFHEREVWFASQGINIGFEQDGRGERFLRPIVVIKKFNNEVLWSVPLTKKIKKGPYYFTFALNENEMSIAILSQLRLLDAKRLQYKMGDMSEKDFKSIKQKLSQLLS